MFSWVSEAALAASIPLLLGLKYLSEWKQDINTFLTSIGTILAVIVIDITVMPYLTSSSTPLVEAANVVGFVVIFAGILLLWHRRIPKVGSEKAEHNALEKITNAGYQGAKIDRTRQSYVQGTYRYIYVNRNSSQGLATHVVEVNLLTGEAKDLGLVPTYP